MVNGVIPGEGGGGSLPIVAGTTYFVDFDSGSDANTCTVAIHPCKHAPGDPNVVYGSYAYGITLHAGDMVAFRGGISYRGSIDVPAAGSSVHQILSEGTGWGGRAIITALGSAPLHEPLHYGFHSVGTDGHAHEIEPQAFTDLLAGLRLCC